MTFGFGKRNIMQRPEIREKVSRALKKHFKKNGHHFKGIKRPKHSKKMIEFYQTKIGIKLKEKKSKWMRKNNPAKRPEIKKKISKSLQGHKSSKERNKKISNSTFKFWQTKNHTTILSIKCPCYPYQDCCQHAKHNKLEG